MILLVLFSKIIFTIEHHFYYFWSVNAPYISQKLLCFMVLASHAHAQRTDMRVVLVSSSSCQQSELPRFPKCQTIHSMVLCQPGSPNLSPHIYLFIISLYLSSNRVHLDWTGNQWVLHRSSRRKESHNGDTTEQSLILMCVSLLSGFTRSQGKPGTPSHTCCPVLVF